MRHDSCKCCCMTPIQPQRSTCIFKAHMYTFTDTIGSNPSQLNRAQPGGSCTGGARGIDGQSA